MVCVKKTLEDMLKELEHPRKIKTEVVVPANFFSADFRELRQHGEFYWLRQYKSQLADFLERMVPRFYYSHILFGPLTPIERALENAYHHGIDPTGKNPDMRAPIYVDIYLGDKGIVFTITDTGKGFDFNKVVAKKRKGRKYFTDNGLGFRVYDYRSGPNPYEVSGEGNRINIMYRFHPPERPSNKKV